jgi:GT2 family glycosyltransferase
MIPISVIVPSRNEGPRILRTLRSIINGRRTSFPLEVIVIDDASTDGSCDTLMAALGDKTNVRLVVHRLNKWSGIPFARNRGADLARHPVLLMTDANTFYPKDWNVPIAKHFHPSRILGGTIADKSTGVRAYGLTLDFPTMGVTWLRDARPFGGYVPIAPCTCTVIDKRLFNQLGQYDETLPLYGAAEPEFSVRAWLSGFEVVNLPSLVVEHSFKSREALGRFQLTNYQTILRNNVRFACTYLPVDALSVVLETYRTIMGKHFINCMEALEYEGVWERRALLSQVFLRDFAWYASRFGLSGRGQFGEPKNEPTSAKRWLSHVNTNDLNRTLAVIPTFGQHHLTRALIDDCFRESVGILVVDNRGDYKQTRHEYVLRATSNLGWLKANNLAIEYAMRMAKWDRFVLLNNDLRLSRDFFAGLVWAESISGASIVGASYDGHWKVQRPYKVSSGEYLPADTYFPEPDVIPFGACDGACVSIHRRVIEQVGYLDKERFGRFGWAALTDLCFRAREAGITTAISRAAFANHLNGGRHTARAVIGEDYEVLAENEGSVGMIEKWGPSWRQLRSIPTTRPCVVYTAITGRRDTLKEPLYVPPGWKFVCFTDTPTIQSSNWEIRPIVWSSPDDDHTRTARWHKVNAHKLFPQNDISIWTDASVQATGDWRHLLWYVGSFGLATYKHYKRDCLYAEGVECARLGLDDPGLIQTQLVRYRAEGYPERNGLFETTILLRRHNDPQMVKFAQLWWNEIMNGSRRDQISVNYAVWRLKLRSGVIRDTLRSSRWLVRRRGRIT